MQFSEYLLKKPPCADHSSATSGHAIGVIVKTPRGLGLFEVLNTSIRWKPVHGHFELHGRSGGRQRGLRRRRHWLKASVTPRMPAPAHLLLDRGVEAELDGGVSAQLRVSIDRTPTTPPTWRKGRTT